MAELPLYLVQWEFFQHQQNHGLHFLSIEYKFVYLKLKRNKLLKANIWLELAEFFLEVDRIGDVQACVEEVCIIYPNSHQLFYLKVIKYHFLNFLGSSFFNKIRNV